MTILKFLLILNTLSVLPLQWSWVDISRESLDWGSLVPLSLRYPYPIPRLADVTAELEEKLQRRRALEQAAERMADQWVHLQAPTRQSGGSLLPELKLKQPPGAVFRLAQWDGKGSVR